MLNALPCAWTYRGNVIPAYAGIQIRGAAWIPACAGMTTMLRAPYVDTFEYITRSSGPPGLSATASFNNLDAIKCDFARFFDLVV
jgi:hypothetical protein